MTLQTKQMENTVAMLEHALEQRNAELELFSSIQEALLSQRNMTYIFELVGNQLQHLFEGLVISIATFDHESGTEHFQYHFEDGARVYSEPRPYNKIRQLLIDTHKQVLVNENAEHYATNILGIEYLNASEIKIPKSFLFAPLMTDEVVRGYISLKHYEKETVFTQEHVRFVTALAKSISVTLQNDRLIRIERRKTEEQKALLDTMTDLSRNLQLNHLLASVLERAVFILGVTGGELAIYHKERKELEVVASHNLGMNSGGVYLKHGEGAMGRVAETKEALIIPDYQIWEGRSDKYTETTVRGVVVVPLIIGNELVGALAVVHLEEDRHFEENDLNLLKLFAPLAATAIENARLFEAEKRKADEQKALLDTMSDLSRKLELKYLLAAVLERAVFLLKVTGGELAIYHEEENKLEVVASHNLGMNSGGVYLNPGEGAMGYVAQTLEPLIIPDYQVWEGRSNKYSKTTARGVMVVPLLSGNKLVGALASVHLEENRHFGISDLNLLNMFAPLAATAIENARLFNKTNLLLEEAEHRATELKRTQDQLVRQEKLASLGELTAGIAHEIQNPLNFVNNFSEMNQELLEEMKTEIDKGNYEEVKLIADDVIGNEAKINHHGKRADGIVKGMLQHSRSTRNDSKEPTDLNALADEYLRLSYHGLRAKDKSFNATMHTDFDPSLEKVSMISQDIGRVILNLFTNAFYSVTEKKRLLSEDDPSKIKFEPTVWISTRNNGTQAEIRIRDNGMGIPDKVMDKIFQPFFTTKPTGEGTGLGLSMSYDIITKGHGGELHVATKEGEFAEFHILLPLS